MKFVDFLDLKADIPQTLTRAQYENFCAKWGVQAHLEAVLGDYGDHYGEYWGMPYDAESDEQVAYLGKGQTAEMCRQFGVERLLRQRRFFSIREEEQPQTTATAPLTAVSGQLWEECRCGSEPIYLPQHLCAKCFSR